MTFFREGVAEFLDFLIAVISSSSNNFHYG